MKRMTIASPPKETPLIMLQQACVPHYRQRFFERLGSDDRFRLVVLADPHADVPFLRLASSSKKYQLEPAKQYAMRLPFGLTLSWQPRVISNVLRQRPAVIVAQGSPYVVTAWWLVLMGRFLGMPVLLWTHGLQGEESGLKWLVRKSLYRLAAGLLLYGDHAKTLLIAKGFAADRLHVIYNSLDVDEQESIFRSLKDGDHEAFRRSLGIEPGERLICFTGRLQPVKRLPWLLRALALVKQRRERVHLAVVGGGGERPKLETLSAELGLAGLVHFLGEVYDEPRLGLVISASDLAVIPSGAGLSVMHALGYGTPVLLHDRAEDHFPEWEAVKEGGTGWFYRYGDLTDCADKITEALFPLPRKRAMAQACRSMVARRYSTTTHARLFIEALAKYCSLAPLDLQGDRAFHDPMMPSGSLGRSVEGRR
jgi:glycosyltransferase involved in cell wall biosynthesis